MEIKPNAFKCASGHITNVSRQKLSYADGMVCPVCGEKGMLIWFGVDLAGSDKHDKTFLCL